MKDANVPSDNNNRKGKLNSSSCATSTGVGKGKPPVEHQFKPGGPPGPGRPRGSRNKFDLEKLLDQRVQTGEDRLGRPIYKTLRRVIDTQLVSLAAKGDLRAMKIVKDHELKMAAIKARHAQSTQGVEEISHSPEDVQRVQERMNIVSKMMILYLEDAAESLFEGGGDGHDTTYNKRDPLAKDLFELLAQLFGNMHNSTKRA